MHLLPLLLLAQTLPADDGYRGIWYWNQRTGDEYVYKYSGGFATYPMQHSPIAVYSAAAQKTFFVYGGRPKDANRLLHMVSYYDHRKGVFPRPRILLDKGTDDAHDNPTLTIDRDGHLWVFSNSHGTERPSFISRSVRPYDITAFERVTATNFSYGNPWFLPASGFFFLHTRYASGMRNLHWMTSRDGRTWEDPRSLARLGLGSYLISHAEGNRVAAILDYHPKPAGLNARTNIYYIETSDAGRTWRNAAGKPVSVPIDATDHPSLVRDYEKEGLLCYQKDLQFDREGRPVILYLTSKHWRPGPEGGPHEWWVARWTGTRWEFQAVGRSDHNYDYGTLTIEVDGLWRFLATMGPGPEPFGTGGEIEMWTSRDEGKTWLKRALTRNSARMHTFPRRPLNANPEFFAVWADGGTRAPSDSSLYFTDRTGRAVWKLPEKIAGETSRPVTIRP